MFGALNELKPAKFAAQTYRPRPGARTGPYEQRSSEIEVNEARRGSGFVVPYLNCLSATGQGRRVTRLLRAWRLAQPDTG